MTFGTGFSLAIRMIRRSRGHEYLISGLFVREWLAILNDHAARADPMAVLCPERAGAPRERCLLCGVRPVRRPPDGPLLPRGRGHDHGPPGVPDPSPRARVEPAGLLEKARRVVRQGAAREGGDRLRRSRRGI